MKGEIYFLPPLPEPLSAGRPLLPEAPEPLYLSLSHKLISALQLSNGTMELSCFAHSIAPHGLSSPGPPKEQNAIPFLSFPQDLSFPTSTGARKQISS